MTPRPGHDAVVDRAPTAPAPAAGLAGTPAPATPAPATPAPATPAPATPHPAADPDALLTEIAATYGTPTFVLDVDRLVANYQAFATAFGRISRPTRVEYSVKTNYLPLVLATVRQLGACADVVSGYEMRHALAQGFAPEQVVFNGPIKTQEEIDLAVRLGVHVNVDGPADIVRLERAARAHGTTVDVGVRVHPAHAVYTSPDPSYGPLAARAALRSKFGWPLGGGEADRLVERISESGLLRLVGVHCHLGTQITAYQEFAQALDDVVGFAARMADRHPVRLLDIGGGFGVPGMHRVKRGPLHAYLEFQGRGSRHQPPPEKFDLTAFVRLLDQSIARHGLGPDVTVACEPGRIIVSSAMRMVSRVMSVKRHFAANWLILDAGQHVMPTANPDEWRRMRVLGRDGEPVPTMVGGPLCLETDILAADTLLPGDVADDDLLVLEDAGAYSLTRSTNFIRERAAVVAVRGGRHELCWRRETDDDVFRFAVPTTIEEEIRYGL